MKQIIWIHGGKGNGKNQFCTEFAKQTEMEMRIISDIKSMSDLKKYTGQPVVLLNTFNPEHCSPALCAEIINDFRKDSGYFAGQNCQTLFITSWYDPDKFYEVSKFAFNVKQFDIKQSDFKSLFTTVFNFETDIDKQKTMLSLIRTATGRAVQFW